jgi:hypothetical protein
MKEFLDVFVFKPKKTERMIIFGLKMSFAFCYSIWIYKSFGFKDIVEQITDINKLKYFLFDGHFILFVFLFLLLYSLFFKFSTKLFSLIGKISMWVAHPLLIIILNILTLVVSLIFWPIFRKFLYRPFTKIIDDNEPLTHIQSFIKWFFLKADILTSPEQKIHSSKEASRLLKEIRNELIENGDKIYNNIHTRFMLGLLLYIYYFYNLHPIYENVPYLDKFIFIFCLITILIQLFLYWVYSHFRIIYFLFIWTYRGIHRQDLQVKLDSLNVLLDGMQSMNKESDVNSDDKK